MIPIRQEVLGFYSEVVRKLRHLAYHTKGAEGRLRKEIGSGSSQRGRCHEPSSGYKCWSIRGVSQSRWPNLGTSPLRQYLRTCKAPNRPRTCWRDSYRCGAGERHSSFRDIGNTHFLREFVTRVRTSWLSSNSSMIPKYPNRLSANLGLATSLRHSIWPK